MHENSRGRWRQREEGSDACERERERVRCWEKGDKGRWRGLEMCAVGKFPSSCQNIIISPTAAKNVSFRYSGLSVKSQPGKPDHIETRAS